MATHWKKLTNPNYLGAYSIENGCDLILTIKYVQEEKVTGTDGKKDDCVVCHFVENAKPMILNATNMKTITKLYKTPYVEEWAGKKIQIGVEKVKAFGDIVDALRVRNTLPKEPLVQHPKCEYCNSDIHPTKKMTAEQVALYTKKKYGQALCSDCATQRSKEASINDINE